MREIGQEGVAHLVFYAFAVVSSFVDADAGIGTRRADFISWQNLYRVVKPTNKTISVNQQSFTKDCESCFWLKFYVFKSLSIANSLSVIDLAVKLIQ